MEYKKNPNVDVKKISQEFKLLGLAFALALSFVLITSTTLKVEGKKRTLSVLSDDTEVIDNTEQKKQEPPKVIPQTIQIVQNNVETPTTIENTELDEEEEIKPPEPSGDGDGKKSPEPEFEKIYEKVEKMPRYIGGDEQLSDFVSGNLEYPAAEKANGVTGKVNVCFVVDDHGKIKDITTDCNQTGNPSKAFKKAAEDVVKKMASEGTKWYPGEQGNKKVSVRCVLPIIFELEDDDY